MIGKGSDDAQCLLEGHLDLKAQAVEFDDFKGGQIQVRGHQED